MNVAFRRIHIRATFLLFLFILFSGFAISACAISYDHATWRYRMTVTVETPEGLKTGSAVREVSAFREPKIFPEQTSGHATLSKGEAVVVDLGKRGVLFALMRGGLSGEDYGYYVVFDAFPYPSKNGGGQLTADGIDYYSHLKAGPVELQPNDYPVFVYFKDPKDPHSIEPVLETGWEGPQMDHYTVKADHTAEIFGKGVKIKSVTIEMTNDPVTREGDKYFPHFDGKPPLVIADDFKKGE